MRIYVRNYFEDVENWRELFAVFHVLSERNKKTLIRKYGGDFTKLIPDTESLFQVLSKLSSTGKRMLCEKIDLSKIIGNADDLVSLIIRLHSEDDKLAVLKKISLRNYVKNSKNLADLIEWLDEKGKEYVFGELKVDELILTLDDFCNVAGDLAYEKEKEFITKFKDLLIETVNNDLSLIKVLTSLTYKGDLYLIRRKWMQEKLKKKHFKFKNYDQYLPQDVIEKLCLR